MFGFIKTVFVAAKSFFTGVTLSTIPLKCFNE